MGRTCLYMGLGYSLSFHTGWANGFLFAFLGQHGLTSHPRTSFNISWFGLRSFRDDGNCIFILRKRFVAIFKSVNIDTSTTGLYADNPHSSEQDDYANHYEAEMW